MRRFAAAVLVVLAAGGAWAATPAGITVSKPWMRFLLPALPAAGYMAVRNHGDTDALLIGAASPACGSLMLHESRSESGMASMQNVAAVAVPAHGSVVFAPGGYHLMCMAPKMKVGQHVAMILTFAGGGAVSVMAPVYGAQGAP